MQLAAQPTDVDPHPVHGQRTLRTIAAFEALKGLAALAAGIGLLSFVHHDIRHLALDLIGHIGLSPYAHYPAVLLRYADIVQDANLRLLIPAALAYVLLRFAEAWGLWFDRPWAQWLGAISGAIYVPFELHHLIDKPTVISALVVLGNLGIVIFLAARVWQQRKAQHARP
ncbi:uncharacterized membrane protein (DUF2068 family) [Silvimonas terrae]|uniref:Uncharacterized membrane protein (DUF2068 family) n=1 Tax=Silvimonas terrae TaxID=300266 RepID=A0A840RM54_9NEIS|nr:DUF2127 domain-containing protein [Silvimonas terrae]MBB5193356.1 uncharacterized membrane protein (DUF2068 family) [Silvimonas terrae]